MASGKRSALIEPHSLRVRDNVPDGCAVSLAGLPMALCFTEVFREELQAKGYGLPGREERGGRKKRD